MAGFVVSARVERTAPHLVRAGGGEADDPTDRQAGQVADLADIRVADPVRDRLVVIRDRWSEMTFFLFDPQSWR
jgi:hypothetical protein